MKNNAATPPKLFISYSWTSQEHVDWVLRLGTDLRSAGIDVILDKWDLKEGHDAHAFMERMVSSEDIKKVLMICDAGYSKKANDRKGGVGVETQIISPEIYAEHDQTKFVAIVSERDADGSPFLPTYYKSRIYIDLSTESIYVQNLEQVVRWAWDEPLHAKPGLGSKPAFLENQGQQFSSTALQHQRLVDAVRNQRPQKAGALAEYLNLFLAQLEEFRMGASGEPDDALIESITKFIPRRNEAIGIFLLLAQYGLTDEDQRAIHRFFESFAKCGYAMEGAQSWRSSDFDNYRFLLSELFLHAVAALLHYERFSAIGYLLRRPYVLNKESVGGPSSVRFADLCQPIDLLERRNSRLDLRMLTLRGTLLKERAAGAGVTFEDLMEADFVLYLRDCVDVVLRSGSQSWWPETLIYAQRRSAFNVFLRARSTEYFDSLKRALDIESTVQLKNVADCWKDKSLHVPKWEFRSIQPAVLADIDLIGTRP